MSLSTSFMFLLTCEKIMELRSISRQNTPAKHIPKITHWKSREEVFLGHTQTIASSYVANTKKHIIWHLSTQPSQLLSPLCKATLRQLWNNFDTRLRQLWNNFGTTLRQLWGKFETFLKQLWDNFETRLRQLWDKIETALGLASWHLST